MRTDSRPQVPRSSCATAGTSGCGARSAARPSGRGWWSIRSLKHIYAQLVNDELGATLLGVSDVSEGVQVDGAGKVGRAKGTGKLLAEKAKAAGISKVVFDRAGYRYHGRVQAVADGAREGGLEF